MNTDPKRPQSSNSDDPWAHLAEDLFGIDLSQSQPADELVLEEEQLPLPIPKSRSSQPTTASKASVEVPSDELEARRKPADEPSREKTIRVVKPVQPAVEADDDSEEEPVGDAAPEDTYWDALEDWDWGEGAEKSAPVVDNSADVEAAEEAAAAASTERDEEWEAAVRARRQKFVEDAEFGFGVGEGEFEEPAPARHKAASKPQRRPTEPAKRPKRPERPSAPVRGEEPTRREVPKRREEPAQGEDAARRKEPERRREPEPRREREQRRESEQTRATAGELDDFGFGAFPEEEEPKVVDTGARESGAGVSEGDSGEEGRPKRRRRRRRRPSDKPSSESRSGAGREPSAPAGRERSREADEVETDDFETYESESDEIELTPWGAEETTGAEAEDVEKPPRERRRRRRRRRTSEPEAQASGFASPSKEETASDIDEIDDVVPVDEELSTEDDASDDDSVRPASVYRNIPTWEQAISYLLDPGQVGVRKIDTDEPDVEEEGRDPSRSPNRRGRRRRSKS